MMDVMLSFIMLFSLLVMLKSSIDFPSFLDFVKPCVFRDYAFRSRASILTASCFLVSFECLRILIQKTI